MTPIPIKNGDKNWKAELANGLAKGGPSAIILAFVLYWAMNIANAKLDKMIELSGDSYRAMYNIEHLLRNKSIQASDLNELRPPTPATQ